MASAASWAAWSPAAAATTVVASASHARETSSSAAGDAGAEPARGFPGLLPPPAKLAPAASGPLPPLAYPEIIRDDGQNINDQILAAYLDFVVPRGCAPGDDGQHGSTAIADIACLQALSRRVHFGKFVAESKFAADADAFRDLAARGDVPGIHALLENVAVEDNVVRRAMLKAVTFGQDAFSGMDPGLSLIHI